MFVVVFAVVFEHIMDLWAAATKGAKELVNLPNLDAMAQEDDYIHTESLNVSQAGATKQEQQQQYTTPTSQHDYMTSSHPAAYPATPPSTASSWMLSSQMAGTSSSGAIQHATSSVSSSSWSLLDRKVSNQQADTISPNVRLEEATARLNAMIFETGNAATTTTNYKNNANESSSRFTNSYHTHTSSSQLRPSSSRTTTSASASIASGTITTSEGEDDDDASQDSYDEDDPILSLLQQQHGNNHKTGSKSNTNNRFMNELDQRLAKPSVPTDEQSLMVKYNNPLQIESGDDNNDDTTKVPQRLWPWQQQRQQRKSTREDENNGNEASDNTPRPLWARPKKKKSKSASDEEFVLVSSGNLGFSEEERQVLANLRKQKAPDSGNMFSDHPRESFIALTLVLGAAVYFYSRLTAADDLAL